MMTSGTPGYDRIQRQLSGVDDERYGTDPPFPFGSWRGATRVEIVDDGETLLAICGTPELPLRWVSADSSMLHRFLQLETAPVESIRDFILDYGPLFVCEHDMPSTHSRNRWPQPPGSTEKVCNPRLRNEWFEEPVSVWRHFSGRANATLSMSAEVHQGRPATKEHWDRLPYVYGGDYENPETRTPSGLIELDRLGIANEVDGWLRGGGVQASLDWHGPSQPQLRFVPDGVFGAVALQLANRVGRIPPMAQCSACNVYYPRLGRAPKRGQNNYCESCRSTAPSRLYRQRQRDAQS